MLKETPYMGKIADTIRSSFDGIADVPLVALVGSRAFNTHVAESDFDFIAAYVPTPERLIGFGTAKTHHFQHKDGGQITAYPIKEYIKLIIARNPNIDFIPYIFRTPVLCSEQWSWLRDSTLFENKGAVSKTYYGYAQGQFATAFEKPKDAGYARMKDWEAYGYVPKALSHSIRILRTGAEYIKCGQMNVYREFDGEELRDIRQGKRSVEELRSLYEELLITFPAIAKSENPRTGDIEQLLIASLKNYL